MINYFTDKELRCPCCKKLIFDFSFRIKLNHARHIANIPFIITSGYRCLVYNQKVGNPNSSHIKGLAVDISAPTSHDRFKILKGLFNVGFTRIGIGPNFIHVDNDMEKPEELCWGYYEEDL